MEVTGVAGGRDMLSLKGCLSKEEGLGMSDECVELRAIVGAVWMVGGVLGEEVGLGVMWRG